MKMRLDELEFKIEELDRHIDFYDHDGIISSLDSIIDLTDTTPRSSEDELDFRRYISVGVDRIELYLDDGNFNEMVLDAAEIKGYVDGVKLAQDGRLHELEFDNHTEQSQLLEDGFIAEGRYQEAAVLRYTRGRKAGINLILNSLLINTDFKHEFNKNQVTIDGKSILLERIHNELLDYLITREKEHLTQNKGVDSSVILTDEEIGENAWDDIVEYKTVGNYMLGLKGQLADENEPQYIQRVYGVGWQFTSNPNKFNPRKLVHHRREYNPSTGEFLNGSRSGILRGRHKQTMDIFYANLSEDCISRNVVNEIWGKNGEITYLKKIIDTIRGKVDLSGDPSVFEGTLASNYRLNLNPSS